MAGPEGRHNLIPILNVPLSIEKETCTPEGLGVIGMDSPLSQPKCPSPGDGDNGTQPCEGR